VKANINHFFYKKVGKKKKKFITCPYMSFFVTKSIFLVLLPNINNIKKALKTCSYQTYNDFLVTTLLAKDHKEKPCIQKLYFPPQSQTGSKRNMMPLNPFLIIEIFDVLGIDFMGPFSELLWLFVHLSCCGLYV
jgi:nitrate reductase NapE component